MPPGAGVQPEESGPDQFSFETTIPTYPGPGRQPPGAGTSPATDRYTFGMPTPTYPRLARQSPGTGIQPAMDWFAYELPPRTPKRPGFDRVWDDWPDIIMIGHREPTWWTRWCTYSWEVEALKFVHSAPLALVKRTGRGHIECAWGEKGHARSPGRLADYRRQFERNNRQEGEVPSTFAIALETLAVKAFGDMGANAPGYKDRPSRTGSDEPVNGVVRTPGPDGPDGPGSPGDGDSPIRLDLMTQSTALFVSTVSTMLFVHSGRVAPLMRTARLGPGPMRRYTVWFIYFHQDPVVPVLRTVTFLRVLIRTLPGTRLLCQQDTGT